MILDVKLKLHVKVKENGKMLKYWRFSFDAKELFKHGNGFEFVLC